MGDPTDQVGTVDTTGLGGIPNVEAAVVAPALLEAAEEAGEEGLSDEEREELPTSLSEQKAEEAGGESAEEAGVEAPDEVAAEEEVLAEETEQQTESSYDPGDHSVAEVLSYLQNNPQEREAILEAERAGKARKGILEA